jgi:PAS domain S-box-containing protein
VNNPRWIRIMAWLWRTHLGRFALAVLILMGASALGLAPAVVLAHEFDSLEQTAIQRDATRMVEGVQNELRILGDISKDWGTWDDSYAFVADRNLGILKSSLDWDALLNTTRVQLVYFLDRDGNIVWSGFHPRDAAQSITLPDFTQERIGNLPLLLESKERPHSGIYLTSYGPLLLVSQPIRPSNNEGPIGGTLLMGRLLDHVRFDNLSNLLAISFVAQDTLRHPMDPEEAAAWALRGWEPWGRVQSQTHLDILVSIPDMYGRERIVFTLPWERTIHVQGVRASRLVFAGLFLATLTLAGMLLLAFLGHLRLIQQRQEFLEASVDRRTQELQEARTRQESLEQHRLIIGLTSSAILIGNARERILECNASASRLFQYSMKELVHLTLPDLFPAEHTELVRRIFAPDASTGDQGHAIEGKRKDGTSFPAEIIAKFFTTQGERRFVAFILDITDRRRAEEVLNYARRQESLGALAGGIAHDFNNLFSGILGNLDLSQDYILPGSPLATHLERIHGEVLRASELSQKMLIFSGKAQFAMGQIDLNRLLEELKPQLVSELAKHASIEFHFAKDLPRVEGDPVQIQQVLRYLVTNASESLGENEGLITVTAAVQDLASDSIQHSFPGQQLVPGPHVMLEVADTGCGIRPEDMPRIFDPFYSTKFAGRGLSLAVAQGMLRAHKAGYAITSAVNVGTQFKLFFAIVPGEHRAPVAAAPTLPLPRGTILFVDDEPVLRETVAEMLEMSGYDVITAQDGYEAVARYKEHRQEIALVILDLTMPRMDGKAAQKEILALNPAAKIVLSSGYSEQDVIQQFRGEALAGFLPKPYRMIQLEELVGRFVRPK